MPPESIRITDLENPVHSEAAKAGFAMIEQVPFELSVDGIFEAARGECDVPLFEEDAWKRRLGAYLEHVLDDPNYTRMGRFNTFNSLKRYLIQRSRLEALYLEHPEIDEIEIERPLIIAGLPRSGTTHLLNLICADSAVCQFSCSGGGCNFICDPDTFCLTSCSGGGCTGP